jgi:CHAT domain-containing protein
MTLLAVAEGRAANLPFLANAAAEADQVQRIAQSVSVAVIPTGQAGPPSTTIDNLKTSLPAADIVHLACHGVQDQEDPLLSGFCFGDDKLTVHDLVRLSLPRAWLAFMSACETAKGDHAQPDQTVHLAAAMLFCGFRSVIGTMWCVLQRLQEVA